MSLPILTKQEVIDAIGKAVKIMGADHVYDPERDVCQYAPHKGRMGDEKLGCLANAVFDIHWPDERTRPDLVDDILEDGSMIGNYISLHQIEIDAPIAGWWALSDAQVWQDGVRRTSPNHDDYVAPLSWGEILQRLEEE